jgi:hypothetical protein
MVPYIYNQQGSKGSFPKIFREEMQLECSHPKNNGVLDGVVHFGKHLQVLS